MLFSIYSMALSLIYSPGTYFSAHGDLIFTLLEDTKPFNSTVYPNYKYICDVYIYGTLQARLQAFPRPDDKIGIFNIGNVVRNYLLMQFLPAANNIRAQKVGENAFYVNVQCKFGEEYGFVTYPNLIVDTQKTYFNHYNPRQAGTLTILSSVIDKAMTVRPYATPVYQGAKYCFIPFLPSDDTTINLVINAYNGSTLAGTTTQAFIPTSASSNEQQLFNVSPAAINAAVPGFINASTSYYTVKFDTTNITDDSLFRFNLVCEAMYDVYTLHFLNRYGGFESRDFTKVSRQSLDPIERSSYGSSAVLITNDGQPHYFDSTSKVYREQNSMYATTWAEKMTLNTDILTDAEYQWLRDLVLSPMVYIEMNGYFYPVSIAQNNYEPKKVINDDLTNLTLNIEFGDRFNTQYR